MDRRQVLLARLDDVGRSLQGTGSALALLALGSVGLETDRLDEHSDLDFFVLVEAGAKERFLADLGWLERARPVAYRFRNTVDGYKVLFDDGVYGEFAVFEPDELPGIPFAPGRIVWKQPQVDDAVAVPVLRGREEAPSGTEWLLGEALSNLYVGLSRFYRGEKLSAARLIQVYAVDRILDLAERIEPAGAASRDRFSLERRFEQRFPGLASELPAFQQGYERSRESARAILDFLERRFEVNAAMARAIREMC
ncbi:MAG TPA: hypothetical protein VL025_21980 [Thermoanaerobaculia bacterium]|nr:hypothetical protein [Thermoanaerobaculia bacterium]